MDVFKIFNKAIVKNYELGEIKYSTVVGNEYKKITDLDCIVDLGLNANANQSPNSASETSDTLLYVKPQQVEVSPQELVASYAIKDNDTNQYYEIVDVGVAKNQENGKIEHYELKLKQTTIAQWQS